MLRRPFHAPNEFARPETALNEAQDVGIQRLRAVEQKDVNRFREINAQRLQGVPLSNLHQVEETAGS
jgi:hypothetical protein